MIEKQEDKKYKLILIQNQKHMCYVKIEHGIVKYVTRNCSLYICFPHVTHSALIVNRLYIIIILFRR